MKSTKELEIHLVHHCNLNCKGCCHFAPLADGSYFLGKDEIESNLSAVTSDKLDYFDCINLMGGEPLLNPNIMDIISTVRAYYPTKPVRLWTNGVLIPEMSMDLIENCHNNNITILVTEYRTDVDYDSIYKALELTRIPYYIVERDNFYKVKLNENATNDKDERFFNCQFKLHRAHQLVGTKLYTCCVSAYIDLFNTKFSKNLSNENSSLDLTTASVDDIKNFLLEPVDFCKYCDEMTEMSHDKSEQDITEWT